MSEMVERVAAHLFAADGNGFFDDATVLQNEAYLVRARAAIEAMREPTVDMQRAGFLALDHQADCNCDQKDVWPAMIDEALK